MSMIIFTGPMLKNGSFKDIYLVFIVSAGSYVVDRRNGNRVLTLGIGLTGQVSQLFFNVLNGSWSVWIHQDSLELVQT